MEWAEDQHFNYLMQVLGKVNESQEERDAANEGTKLTSDADILQSMGYL